MRLTTGLVTFTLALGVTLAAQTAIPTQGGRGDGAGGRGGGQGRGGAAAQPSNLPASPVVTALPTVSAQVSGPGPMFESLMELKPGDDVALMQALSGG